MKKTIIVAFVLAAVVGLVVAGSAFAQDGNPPFEGKKGTRGDSGVLLDYISEAMADALGITVEELEAARQNGGMRELIQAQGFSQEEMQTLMQEARTAASAAALADGVITQEQIDQMQSYGGKRGGRDGAGQFEGRGPQDGSSVLHDYMSKAMADALGVTVEELQASHDVGTLRDLALAQGITVAEIPALMQGAHDAAVEAALADGVITQEQIDVMQAGGGKRGGRGGSGQIGGGRGGNGGQGFSQ